MIFKHDYNPLTALAFKGKPRGQVFFGVELEVEVDPNVDRDTAAIQAVEILGSDFAIVKRDGSLKHGIEIVSAPAPLTIHKRRWPKLFNEVAKQNVMVSAETTCGLHIHISRQPLKMETPGFMSAFVTRPENRDFIVAIAGREKPDFASLAKKDPEVWKHQHHIGLPAVDVELCSCLYCQAHRAVYGAQFSFHSAKCKCQHDDDAARALNASHRYSAVNLTRSDTIEIRIFASTVDTATFLQRLEFASAMTWFCNQPPGDLSHTAFLTWLNATDYPELAKWARAHFPALHGGRDDRPDAATRSAIRLAAA